MSPVNPRRAAALIVWIALYLARSAAVAAAGALDSGDDSAVSLPGSLRGSMFGAPRIDRSETGARGAWNLAFAGAPRQTTPFESEGNAAVSLFPLLAIEGSLHVASTRVYLGRDSTPPEVDRIWSQDVALRVHVGAASGGVWVGGWRGLNASVSDETPSAHAEVGGSWAHGPFASNVAFDQALSAPPRLALPQDSVARSKGIYENVPGFKYTTTRLEVAWGRAPWMFALSGATQMASGAETRRWLRGRAGVRIIPDAWLVVSMGREPTQAFGARMTPGTSLAVIVSGIPHRTEHPTRPSSPTFVARSMREGLVRFEVAAPNAHRVEISGDFSGWEPVALASVSGGKWRADVRAESGMHRLLMRVDGGEWTPPPDLPVARDELLGDVGVVTVE
jgi:hypothetical protein